MLHVLNLMACSVMLFHGALCSKFIKGRLSNKDERLRIGCLKNVGVISLDIMDCARACLLDDKCEGFYMDEDRKCYIHFHCKQVADSSDELTYFQRSATRDGCLNAGTWKPVSQTCQCSGGLVGLRCERFAESCKELFQMGYPASTRKPYTIQPQGLDPFLTQCAVIMNEVRTDVFLHSAEGLLSFNRPLTEYIAGFYYKTSEYWIGLEKIHVLNTVGGLSDMSFNIMFNNIIAFQFVFRRVAIGDASAGYTFIYSDVKYSESGPIGVNATVSNCIPGAGKATPFSAPDADNDAEPFENCAEISGTGWWFSSCDPYPVCNPLGVPVTPETVNITQKHMMFSGLDLKAYASQFQFIRIFFFEPLN